MEIVLEKAGDEYKIIKEGLFLELPQVLDIPKIELNFRDPKNITISNGMNYFAYMTKLNDLSMFDTKILQLHINPLMSNERDIQAVIKWLSNKFSDPKIETRITIEDQSAPKRFYREETAEKKSGNLIKNNNFYCYNIKDINLGLLNPILNKTEDTIYLIKFPTIISENITDILYLYSWLCGQVFLFKHPNDSWFKDSFIMVGMHPDKRKLGELRSTLKDQLAILTKSNPNLYSSQFSLWSSYMVHAPPFINMLKSFKSRLILPIYSLHSLLVKSVTSPEKNIKNDFSKKLNDILNS